MVKLASAEARSFAGVAEFWSSEVIEPIDASV